MDRKIDKRKRTRTMLEIKCYHKQDGESPAICKIVNNIFEKSFTIKGNEQYVLPKPESMFVENLWKIDELQRLKTDLNEIKSKLNNYCFSIWHQHTSQRNKAKDVEWRVRRDFDPEFVTQAWCKFHEIVSKYPIVPKESIYTNNNKFLSLHLCEAPGAFITCLNHWLKTNAPTIQWDWLAMTYNPYYEGNSNSSMISDDRFIMYTLNNWFFGKDNTGNLMNIENLDTLIVKAKAKGKINLITADGSVNCIGNPGEQEEIVASLHFCEVTAAMHILETDGNLLLKIFTIFEHQSICLIYFLSCVFTKVHFYKPVTSKEGNSEVYLICLKFKGLEFVSQYLPILKSQYGKSFSTTMFRKDDIPETFIQQIVSCAKVFKNYQCEVIENNIAAYHSNNQNLVLSYEEKKIAKLVADKYITNFPLQKLHMDLQIVGNLNLKKNKNNHWVVEPPAESFNERQKRQVLEPVNRLLMYREILQAYVPVLNTLIFKPANFPMDICIGTGKPYQRTQSSRFCPMQISESYNLLFQAVDMEKQIQLLLPTKENIMEYESKMQDIWNSKYKVVHFQYTETCDNNRTITLIKEILASLQKEDNLVIFGFLLLTQFNVGLVYLLAETFNSVEFTTNEQIGCCITFQSFKNKESIMKKIQQIYEAAQLTLTNNTMILSIVPMIEIYGSKLYPIILQINNWIVKYCADYIASVYEEKI